MSRKSLLLVFVSLIFVGIGFSQTPAIRWALFGTVSLPVGDFGEDRYFDLNRGGDGAATTGFGAGVELIYPLGTPGLGWHTTAAFIYQGYDDVLIRQWVQEDLGSGANVDAGNYFIIPIMTGISYNVPVSPEIGIILIGQAGLGLIKKTTMTASVPDTASGEIELDMATSFGFGIGAGLVFNDKFNISVRYMGFGEPDFEYTILEDSSIYATGKWKIPVSTILITAGIYF